MKLTHHPLLVTCCLLLALTPGLGTHTQAENFGTSRQANVKVFLSDSDWRPLMKSMADWEAENGQPGCYTLLADMYGRIMSRNLQQIEVLEMKAAYALASYLVIDRLTAENQLKAGVSNETARMMLNAIVTNHRNNAQDIIDPFMAQGAFSQMLNLTENEETPLLKRLCALFMDITMQR